MTDSNQEQTRSTFSYKWGDKRHTYDSPNVRRFHFQWWIDRHFETVEKMEMFFAWCKGKKMLDAGCGNGFTASVVWNTHLNEMDYLGIDIADDAVAAAKKRFVESKLKGKFELGNIQTMQLDQTFDLIVCSGVIHHTSDPKATFMNLANHLRPGGQFVFYVYKKKAPVREFVDDYVRDQLEALSDEEAWNKLIPLTLLGKTLGELDIEIELNQDVELLGIPKGKHNLQRLFYWNFCKAFYRPEYSVEEMNHINFDWYRPLNCFRFEPDEIQAWLDEAGLQTNSFKIIESGIAVVAQKP